jgi:hypothetical protein
LAAPGARAATAKASIDGLWGGALQVAGQELRMAVQFKTEGKELKATIDIPEQGAKALPLTSMREVKARLRQHGVADNELIRRESVQMFQRRPVLRVARVAQRHHGRRVYQDHGLTGRSLRRIAARAARGSWTS